MVHKLCIIIQLFSSASCRPSILQQIEDFSQLSLNLQMVGTSPGMQLLLTLSILFISSTNQGEKLHFCNNSRFIASCFACYQIYTYNTINQAKSHINIDSIVNVSKNGAGAPLKLLSFKTPQQTI